MEVHISLLLLKSIGSADGSDPGRPPGCEEHTKWSVFLFFLQKWSGLTVSLGFGEQAKDGMLFLPVHWNTCHSFCPSVFLCSSHTHTHTHHPL